MNASNTTPSIAPQPLDEGDSRTARQRRALAKRCAQVERWHAAIPVEQRRLFYPSELIAAATKLDPGQLGPALRALGWQHAQRRLPERAGLPVSVWAPPTAPNPRRPANYRATPCLVCQDATSPERST